MEEIVFVKCDPENSCVQKHNELLPGNNLAAIKVEQDPDFGNGNAEVGYAELLKEECESQVVKTESVSEELDIKTDTCHEVNISSLRILEPGSEETLKKSNVWAPRLIEQTAQVKILTCNGCRERAREDTRELSHATDSTTLDKDLHSNAMDNGPYFCNTCGKEFFHLRHPNGPQLNCTTNKPHLCTICGKAFREKRKLKVHSLIHSGQRPYSCESCGKSFVQCGHLKLHIQTHAEIEAFSCKMCDKKYKSLLSLKGHMAIHQTSKNFSCAVCGASFYRKYELNSHTATHSNKRCYICDLCGKSYKKRCHLEEHMITHSGTKPFCCTICSKAFIRPSKLKRHILTHTDRSPDGH